MRFSFAIYQQNKPVCLNWNKLFRNFLRSLLVLVYFIQCLYGESLWLFVFVSKKTLHGHFQGWSARVEKLREWQWKILKNSVCCFSLFLYLHNVLFCLFFLFFLFSLGGRRVEFKFITTLIFNTALPEKWKSITCITFGAVAWKGFRNLS